MNRSMFYFIGIIQKITNIKMRERRNTICEGNQTLNPCLFKIFPFLSRPNPQQSKTITNENSSRISNKNYHNLNTKDNNKIALSLHNNSKTHKRYSSFTGITIKNNLSINESKSIKQTQNYETERSEISNAKLLHFQSLIKQNAELMNVFSKLQSEMSMEEEKLEKSNERYVEFIGSRNERNKERVRELMGRIEENAKGERKKEMSERQNMWMQLENMQLSRKSIRTSRNGKGRLY